VEALSEFKRNTTNGRLAERLFTNRSIFTSLPITRSGATLRSW
jgi:hypothetical protein